MTVARAEVLSLFLAQRGVSLSTQRVLELTRGVLDRRAVLRVLRQSGLPTRGVAPSGELLTSLPLPTLLELRGERLCVLERVNDGAATVRDESKRVLRTPLRELAGELTCAFESLPVMGDAPNFIRWLLRGLAEQVRELSTIGLSALALTGLALLAPWLTRCAIGGALEDRSPSLLHTVVVALAAAAVLRAWLMWLRARAQITLAARLLRRAVPSLFERLLTRPFAEQEQRGLSDELACLGSGEAAARAETALVVGPAVELLGLLAYFVACALCSVPIASVLLVASVLTVAVSWPLMAHRARADGQVVRESAVTRARLHDMLQGIATVKAERAERPILLRWLESLLRERGASLRRDLRDGWHELWLAFCQRGTRLFVICYGAHATLEGGLSVADFIYVGLLAEGVLGSLESGCRMLGSVLSLRLHAERVDRALYGCEPLVRPPTPEHSGHVPLSIHLSDVWFRHGPDQPWVLSGYDLTVQAGEQLTLRGESGSGKTTILRLIAGMYRPERGTVSVGGRDPCLDHSAICYLPQQAAPFAGSLRNNLEQLSGATPERIQLACERTGLQTWLRSLPMGVETLAAAQGANLSGGQRQWLLLTAAVANERGVVLLDESASQLDHVVRARMPLTELFRGPTVVSAAHD
jgi:ABC-type bacteriocin/lantibiotic exporter with double-glycine peptidase domain